MASSQPLGRHGRLHAAKLRQLPRLVLTPDLSGPKGTAQTTGKEGMLEKA